MGVVWEILRAVTRGAVWPAYRRALRDGAAALPDRPCARVLPLRLSHARRAIRDKSAQSVDYTAPLGTRAERTLAWY